MQALSQFAVHAADALMDAVAARTDADRARPSKRHKLGPDTGQAGAARIAAYDGATAGAGGFTPGQADQREVAAVTCTDRLPSLTQAQRQWLYELAAAVSKGLKHKPMFTEMCASLGELGASHGPLPSERSHPCCFT